MSEQFGKICSIALHSQDKNHLGEYKWYVFIPQETHESLTDRKIQQPGAEFIHAHLTL